MILPNYKKMIKSKDNWGNCKLPSEDIPRLRRNLQFYKNLAKKGDDWASDAAGRLERYIDFCEGKTDAYYA